MPRAGRPTCSAGPSPRTRPTARRSSGSTCRTRPPGRTARAAPPGRRPAACRATASTASAARRPPPSAAGMCRSCNVAGIGRHVQQRARRGRRTTPARAIQACDASQQCKALLGQTCSSFTECASGNCTDGVCCNTACTGTCQQCNLAAKRGTCSPVPNGDRGSGRRASPTSTQRGSATAPAPAPSASGRTAGRAPRAAVHERLLHRRLLLQQRLRETCYQCARPGAEGSCAVIPIGQPDHSATTPCDGPMQYCNGSGTCATNKKPNGGLCPGGASECGSNFCVDGICCNNTCLGTCQSCNVTGQRWAPASTPAPARRT